MKWEIKPPAWPVAPRPFAMEPIGGWLGRVAARYRMSVDELAQMYELEIVFDRLSSTWLHVSTIGEATVEKLAALARMNVAVLNALQWPLTAPAPPATATATAPQRQLAYCPSCVFLNPLDVESPCWKREWMESATTCCQIHTQQLQKLPIASVRRCGNFDHVLRVISRREASRRERLAWSVSPR